MQSVGPGIPLSGQPEKPEGQLAPGRLATSGMTAGQDFWGPVPEGAANRALPPLSRTWISEGLIEPWELILSYQMKKNTYLIEIYRDMFT